MSGLTNYLTQDGIDLSYVFQPKNSIPATNQNFVYSGTNTFLGITTFSALQLSYGPITDNITLTSPILNFYHVTSSAVTTTITLPNPLSFDSSGSFIIFKHTATGNITLSCSVQVMVGLGNTGAAFYSVSMPNAKVIMVTCNGNAWWVYYYIT